MLFYPFTLYAEDIILSKDFNFPPGICQALPLYIVKAYIQSVLTAWGTANNSDRFEFLSVTSLGSFFPYIRKDVLVLHNELTCSNKNIGKSTIYYTVRLSFRSLYFTCIFNFIIKL